MTVETPVQPDHTTQSGSQYKANINNGMASIKQIADHFAPHEQTVPDMTVRLEAGRIFDLSGASLTEVAAQSTNPLTAPSFNPRKDIIYVDSDTGSVGVATGTEAASPTDPVIPTDKIPIARVTLQTTTTEIANSTIDDLRAVQMFGAGGVRGHIAGLQSSSFGSPSDQQIDIAVGECRDDGNADTLILSTVLTKLLNATWVVGDNQGGLDAGSLAADTWYHVWLIKRSDTGTVDALFSTSATSPTMPTNYDKKRRIGAVRTDASQNIIPFTQRGDFFEWTDPPLDVDVTDQGASTTARTLSVPTGVEVYADIQTRIDHGTSGNFAMFRSANQLDEAPSTSVAPLGWTNGGTSSVGRFFRINIWTDTNGDIYVRGNTTSIILKIVTIGYMDRRGRDD